MTEENNTGIPEADRYAVEYVELGEGTKQDVVASLQGALNEGTRQSWRLIGIATDPYNSGVLVVWDQQGFISG